jgi:hypothetical protein
MVEMKIRLKAIMMDSDEWNSRGQSDVRTGRNPRIFYLLFITFMYTNDEYNPIQAQKRAVAIVLTQILSCVNSRSRQFNAIYRFPYTII